MQEGRLPSSKLGHPAAWQGASGSTTKPDDPGSVILPLVSLRLEVELGVPGRRCAPGPWPASRGGGQLRHRLPGPPPPTRPNSTPREGGADKGSGAARPAPDRPGHRALSPPSVARAEPQGPKNCRARSCEQRLPRLLLREGTRRVARPEQHKHRARLARAAPPQGPAPHQGRHPSPSEELQAQTPPRGATREADATSERHSDFLISDSLFTAGTCPRDKRTAPPPPKHPEKKNPVLGESGSQRRGEDWRSPAAPSPPALAGDGAAARRRPELPARGPRRTTGTRYDLSVPPDETVEGLRKRLSQRLKVPKE
ncbi:PREDICTED: basic salivary proline-rich protein 2-like, partial [Dipodomys ordii]|uniref:Basic salivary proline-rich protein 2-like n=1 Tax=Dipodomys ordii TaxID=10020 RepID=A0A1S3GUD0_DIPOR